MFIIWPNALLLAQWSSSGPMVFFWPNGLLLAQWSSSGLMLIA
jgi:hypothetical protein